VQGQLARREHCSSGKAGASFDKKRFLRKSCAAAQLRAFVSTLIACHFFGMLVGRALVVPTLVRPMMGFTLEPTGAA
jgi:hypothetical protein